MYIFLDESGDLGLDFNHKKSSRYFIITILAADDFSNLKIAVKRTLKNKIKHKKNNSLTELKGSSTTLGIKEYFYKQLKNKKGWFLQTIIMDKKSLIKHPTLLKKT